MVGTDMKKVMVCLLFLLMSSFVMAVSSEVITDFNVGNTNKVVAQNYVPPVTFWDTYGTYIIALVIVLIVVIVFAKSKKKKVVVVRRVRKVKKKKSRK